ncbi:MAG TPA: exo-alpha-sialidase [Bacteroidetes bacterium]|nr:exo-alpha-sialidase [Bacteroidota bacterium]
MDSDFTSQYKLYFSKLEEGVWSSPQPIISSDKYSPLYDFDFTIDSQNQIHLVYTQTVSGSGYIVHYIFYNGTAWSNPQKVCQGFSPSIEVDLNDKVHIVYSSFSDIFYSNLDGTNWSSPVNVSDDGQLYGDYTSGAKAIRIDKSGNIHIAWAKYNFGIMYTKFDGKWSVPQLVSKLALWPDNTYWLSLGANGVVAVAYTQGPNDCINQEIYFSLSEDGGLSWYSPTQISETPGIGSRWPSLAIVSANNIQAIWGECQTGVPFRLFDGNSWSDIIDISNGTQKADLPNISTDGNKSYAVWSSNGEIYFSQGQ